MCLKPKIPKDNSAEIARQQEEARAAKIREGQSAIDSKFDSQFNDPYFSNIESGYLDYYNPQLQEQYDDAVKQLTYSLARSGNAESTTNNEQFGKLEQKQLEARTKIADDAKAASAKARGDVAQQRSSLYSLNNSAADPNQAASQAAQAALQLAQPQSYSPLGSIFSSLINTGGNIAAVNQAQTGNIYGSGNGPSAPSTTNTKSGFSAN